MALKFDDVKSSMSRVVDSMDAVRAVAELERAIITVNRGDAFSLGELHAHADAIERALRTYGKATIFQSRIADARTRLDEKKSTRR